MSGKRGAPQEKTWNLVHRPNRNTVRDKYQSRESVNSMEHDAECTVGLEQTRERVEDRCG